jgi:hypothetical protein
MKLPFIISRSTYFLTAIAAANATLISSTNTPKPSNLGSGKSPHEGFRNVGYYGNWVSRIHELLL